MLLNLDMLRIHTYERMYNTYVRTYACASSTFRSVWKGHFDLLYMYLYIVYVFVLISIEHFHITQKKTCAPQSFAYISSTQGIHTHTHTYKMYIHRLLKGISMEFIIILEYYDWFTLSISMKSKSSPVSVGFVCLYVGLCCFFFYCNLVTDH